MSKTFSISSDGLVSSMEGSAGLENSGWFDGGFFNHFETRSPFLPLPCGFAVPVSAFGQGLSEPRCCGSPQGLHPWDRWLPQPSPMAASPRGGLCHSSV